ncbi:MAG: hypothetical protein ACOYVF_00175 [Candidatus Zixiibacteriota bacterium]
MSAVSAQSETDCARQAVIRATARVEYPLGITSLLLSESLSENTRNDKISDSPGWYFYTGNGEAQYTLTNDRGREETVVFSDELSSADAQVFSGGKVTRLTASDILRFFPAQGQTLTLTVVRPAD